MMNCNFVFFGGEPLAVPLLEKLYASGYIPKLIICNPDRPVGRKLILTPPPTKVWAEKNNIPVLQPEKLDSDFMSKIQTESYDLFIVVAYGKIIPQAVLDIPQKGTLNVHPSLLPLYRGPAPITAPILNGDIETGVTIIKLDALMDHGPIFDQIKIELSGNEFAGELTEKLADIGGELLIATLPKVMSGEIIPHEQDHSEATIVKKILKASGEINLNDNGILNWRKYRAYFGWPGTFYFDESGKRIIIKEATFENGNFIIKKILREGESKVVSFTT